LITETEAMMLLEDSGCPQNVIEHCKVVSSFAVEIAEKIQAAGHEVNPDLVRVGGLLHDIGRCHTHSVLHAVEGFKLAQSKGIDPEIYEIIKRHIGAGISKEEAKKLGLPEDDYFPRRLEEKIVAHADNLVKGTEITTLDKAIMLMRKKEVPEKVIKRIKALAEEIEKLSH